MPVLTHIVDRPHHLYHYNHHDKVNRHCASLHILVLYKVSSKLSIQLQLVNDDQTNYIE